MSDTSDTQVPVVLLSADEDSFAMAVVEYGGNIGAAYKSVFGEKTSPVKRAQALINRPEIALRIQAISAACNENALISLGSHLMVLADLRDQSVKLADMRTALACEVKRGEVAGFYKDKVVSPEDGPRRVTINIGTAMPGSIEQWGAQFGKAPVIIDMER